MKLSVETYRSSVFTGPITDSDGEEIVIAGGDVATWEGYFAAAAFGEMCDRLRRGPVLNAIVDAADQEFGRRILFGGAS